MRPGTVTPAPSSARGVLTDATGVRNGLHDLGGVRVSVVPASQPPHQHRILTAFLEVVEQHGHGFPNDAAPIHRQAVGSAQCQPSVLQHQEFLTRHVHGDLGVVLLAARTSTSPRRSGESPPRRLLGTREGATGVGDALRIGPTEELRRTGQRRSPTHRAITSRANARYAAAPLDRGAQRVIGSPATVVSGNRTVRLITVSNTVSPNASTTRAMTSLECRVLGSNMVARMPLMSNFGFSRSRTFSIVSINNAIPRRLKNSHSSGMITLSAAVNAFTVSSPSDGWQSTRM